MLGRETALVPNDGLVQEIIAMIERGDFGVVDSRRGRA